MSQLWMFFSTHDEALNSSPPGKAIVDYLMSELPNHKVPCIKITSNDLGWFLIGHYCGKDIKIFITKDIESEFWFCSTAWAGPYPGFFASLFGKKPIDATAESIQVGFLVKQILTQSGNFFNFQDVDDIDNQGPKQPPKEHIKF
ncbi:hypothetical protein H0A36_22335 [Endozoicomonas sp. SM1973]|uniref:Uncharacterized protein n=1 Tax=Spartinivicinus marinus TaxID=2994442 RepID=A0A853I7G9_9GAMM|nr:hypothetical protein [Spartinivicinus marinus]MCX4024808.1 hypothetical protein [Spartinivicinus marinus]NYZ68759.1 hypothetical protein [Spartinivicinus marinus]